MVLFMSAWLHLLQALRDRVALAAGALRSLNRELDQAILDCMHVMEDYLHDIGAEVEVIQMRLKL